MTPERLARLLTWATRSHPDHPSWGQHDYIGDCPWCRSDEPKLLEGGAHSTAQELVQRLIALEAWLASAEATMLAAIDDRPGWRDEAGLLVAGLYGERQQGPHPGGAEETPNRRWSFDP